MPTHTKNPYLLHYARNGISPVRQNISDYKKHISRRKLLYQNLGITKKNFFDNKVLEIGPGSGFNALAVAEWSPSEYILIEPNMTGVIEIESLFSQYQLSDKIKIHNTSIEDYDCDLQFDICICEGMLPGIHNRVPVLNKIGELTKPEGVLVITCADDISMFFEIMRRFFSHEIVNGIDGFEESSSILVSYFGDHLKTIQGMTRPALDWVHDSLMGTAILWHSFSIVDACDILGNEFMFYHMCSPNLINNVYWYKHYPLDNVSYNNSVLRDSYFENAHNLLHYKSMSHSRPKANNKELLHLCSLCTQEIKSHVINNLIFDDTCEKLEKYCIEIHENVKNIDNFLGQSLMELIKLLNSKSIKDIKNVDVYPAFCSAFGRGQQYISFVKNSI